MASLIFKSISKSNPIRPLQLYRLQTRNTGTATENASTNPKASVILPMAVGFSLAAGLAGLVNQSKLVDRLFPSRQEPVQEQKIAPTEQRLLEEIISLNRKYNLQENEINNLRNHIRESEIRHNEIQPITPTSNVDVFELSKIIEANDLASRNRHIKEMEDQRRALEREHLLQVEGEVHKVENRYRPFINKVRELELYMEAQSELQKKEAPARLLWLTCQALLDRMRSGPQGPLENDPAYDVLKRFAANNNTLAISVLDSIPVNALVQGVQSEQSLVNRFSKIERICKRVDRVGDGGGLAKYMVSYLQSLFIFDGSDQFFDDEVKGKYLVDPTVWTTFDIVARVKYCLLMQNLEQAVRYANQLRGQARVVARDWIRDARVHLETRQAISVLLAHSEAIAVDAVGQTYVE